ncbi:glycosyl transferase [Rhizobium lemnae]|uniref:Glycosyl transferase n=1 Tax=Rhizobium lemnae TaxID=1214924 RepID=A0ABV8E7F4_9HYPH|nr:glycosyl transferase [Rhizobium lemnae]MCJ8508332.1 glycosyl transferase [Rhizobium lemnae]
MLTVLMECHDQESELAQTLSVLVAGAVEGLVSDVAVLDHGSTDASARVADAAGCKFYTQWDLKNVLQEVRGEWLLLLEPGARPQIGWIDEVAEHISLTRHPARFTASRNYRRPLMQRLFSKDPPLAQGLLIQKSVASAKGARATRLADLVEGHRPHTLISELIPAWAAARS